MKFRNKIHSKQHIVSRWLIWKLHNLYTSTHRNYLRSILNRYFKIYAILSRYDGLTTYRYDLPATSRNKA